MKLIQTKITTKLNPVYFYNRIRNNFDYTFILESMDEPTKFAKQSIIGFDPHMVFKIIDDKLICEDQVCAKGAGEINSYLDNLLQKYSFKAPISSLDTIFQGGLVGFTSYDFINVIEQIDTNQGKRTSKFPNGVYGLYLDGITFNHITNEIMYFHHSEVDSRFDDLTQNGLFSNFREDMSFEIENISHNTSKIDFEESVKNIKENIKAGETFQTVLSQRIDFSIIGDPLYVYHRLRQLNPSPYMFVFEFQDYTIIGSSPELLIAVEDDVITTYPIAGTRPRSHDLAFNRQMEQELRNDEKEKAEHNMLVDLARNDIGKVSELGTVEVTEYQEVEYFSHVMHLVSKVQGNLDENQTMFDAFSAVFPAGTVSGAPKLRSMELIEKLEPTRRGPYAGAVGYFGINNLCEQAITIRTMFGYKNKFSIQAGAGIVLDSDPEKEYFETLDKLKAFLEILDIDQ